MPRPHGESSEGFKTIVYGGAPMYAADIQRALRVMGPRFVQIYGQGETPMTAPRCRAHHLADAGHPRHAARIASVGVAQTPVAGARGRARRRAAARRRDRARCWCAATP
jgi:long-chain acyl-CoA synthetase